MSGLRESSSFSVYSYPSAVQRCKCFSWGTVCHFSKGAYLSVGWEIKPLKWKKIMFWKHDSVFYLDIKDWNFRGLFFWNSTPFRAFFRSYTVLDMVCFLQEPVAVTHSIVSATEGKTACNLVGRHIERNWDICKITNYIIVVVFIVIYC